MDKALEGVVVVEKAGRLAISVCGALLAELGATVIRVEPQNDNPDCPSLALPGKHRVHLPADLAEAMEAWRRLAAVADAVVLSPDDGLPLENLDRLVICRISPYGSSEPERSADTPEWVIQAEAGIMAVTGSPGGPPQLTRFAVFEMFAAINAATSILAALRVARRDGAGQSIDIALFDAAFAMLGTHISAVAAGKPRGHRVGCKHPLCSPWDIFQCGSAAVQICVASEAQWQRLVRLMEASHLLADPRFADSGSRVKHAKELGEILQTWLSAQDPDKITSRLTEVGIAAAKVERLDDVLRAREANGALHSIHHDNSTLHRARSILKLARTPGIAPQTIESVKAVDAIGNGLTPRLPASPGSNLKAPLDGIRAIEIGPYTAGPLTGRYLTGLGAMTLKIEPPQGEDSRRFEPKFGKLSGFFSNYNFGKASFPLDLKQPADRAKLIDLLRSADVLLQNLKPGTLKRMDIDTDEIAKANPGLITCAISGYGEEGPPHPALDTVIQAQSGVMSLLGRGDFPTKSGFSLADLIAAHVAPLAVVAALHYRDRTGIGQNIDISMLDCLVWALQPAWNNNESEWARLSIVEAADGYVVVLPGLEINERPEPEMRNKASLSADFTAQGAKAAVILELDEVLRHPAAVARGLLSMKEVEDGALTPVLTSPYRLHATPPAVGHPVRELASTDLAWWLQ